MAKTATIERQPDLLGQTELKIPTKGARAIAAAVKKEKPGKQQLAVVPPEQPRNLLALIMQAVTDPRYDGGKVRELLTMQREVEEREEARLFNAAMLACQLEIDPIVKDRLNKHTNSKWATLETISRHADPVIRKHGFTISSSMGAPRIPEHYLVYADVSHVGGHTRRYEADVGMDSKGPKGEGNKSLAQGSGSSASYARRYLKVMIFDIKIVGEDNDGAGAPKQQRQQAEPKTEKVAKITGAQVTGLIEKMEQKGVTREEVCEKYKISALSEITTDLLVRINSALDNTRR